MKVAIICNASLQTKEYLYQPNRLKEEFATYGIKAEIVLNNQYNLHIEAGQIQNKFAQYSFIIFLDKDKYLLEMLTKIGIPIFNNKDAILKCDDKMLTYIFLSNYNIPMPKTIPGYLAFYKNIDMIQESINLLELELEYPFIAKESYGSCGKGVYLIENREKLQSMLEILLYKPHLFQEFIEESAGIDIRVIVIGGKVIGAIQRSNMYDFRSNIEQGGKGSIYHIDIKLKKLAEDIASILDLDYCGIDFLKTKSGYSLCEVNSNAFFKTFEEVTDINIAKHYVEYLLERTKLLDKNRKN